MLVATPDPPAPGPRGTMIRRHPTAAYFVLAYGISWAVWAPLWLPALGAPGLPKLPLHHFLGAAGPIGAAFLVTAAGCGRDAAARLLRAMGALRGRGVWVVVAALGPLALVVLAVVGAALVAGGSTDLARVGRSAEFPGLGPVGLFVLNLVTFGFGEEVGWRGFALPRLQVRRSAWRATLLLTVGWAGWHLPLFAYRPGYAAMGPAEVLGWLVSLITGAVLLTWLYNESRGSLLVVSLFHASVDVAFTSTLSTLALNLSGALITLWGVAILLTVGPRELSRRGRVVHSPGPGAAWT